MKKYILFFWFILFGKLYAQDFRFDNPMAPVLISCADIEYNCSALFEKYYGANEMDSVHMLLEYWQSECGYGSLVFRLKRLVELKEGTFEAGAVTARMIGEMVFMKIP